MYIVVDFVSTIIAIYIIVKDNSNVTYFMLIANNSQLLDKLLG